MANTDPPRRRFVPVPIETTFQSYRKNVYDYTSHQRIGPNPELTPEPSPRSPLAHFPLEALGNEASQERRRFAPQLIETSRRSRRVGEPGPATRPEDKTDITPYTNHIYSAKHKSNRRQHGAAAAAAAADEEPRRQASRPFPPTRRETEEEGVQEYLLELAAKEVARQIEEAALAAFPNSRPREGGVAHFYFREGSSDSENSPEASPRDEEAGQHRLRRKSSNLGLNWWHKHMQEHASRLEQEKAGEDDQMDIDNEEAVVMTEDADVDVDADAVAAAAPGAGATAGATAGDSPIFRSDSDLDKMELPSPPDLMWTTTKPLSPTDDRRDSVAELQMALAEANRHAAQSQAQIVSSSAQAVPPTQAQGEPAEPHRGRQEASPFGRPFGGFRHVPDHDPKLLKLRQGPSPPMLGRDLVFRRCPSPKFTTLEPEDSLQVHMIEDQARDLPGQAGLWRGYCCRSESTGGCIVPPDLHNPKLIQTPTDSSFPDKSCSCDVVDASVISEEPVSIFSPSESASSGLTSSNGGGLWGSSSHSHQQQQQPQEQPQEQEHKGDVDMVNGLNERLLREKAQAERDEKILQEFGEDFVTQVYNYLSLGYPAMARGFDEELSRISHIGVDELRRDDAKQLAKGHMVEMKLDASAPEEERCPRWAALRSYITEWARQHPDLDNLDPLAWGVRERRGSWAI